MTSRKRRLEKIRLLSILAAAAALLAVAGVSAIDRWVVRSTEDRIFTDTDLIPANRVGLVLGTSHRTRAGRPNPFFENRIRAAVTLYRAGKVEHLLLSGDNGHAYYNEPLEMKKALVERGIPAESLTLDYAGFRTLDSVVRTHRVFGQDRFTIISQKSHGQRALFIARHAGLDAVAFAARPPSYETRRQDFREVLARVKAVLDLYLFGTEPKFLGEPVVIDPGPPL